MKSIEIMSIEEVSVMSHMTLDEAEETYQLDNKHIPIRVYTSLDEEDALVGVEYTGEKYGVIGLKHDRYVSSLKEMLLELINQ